MSHVVNNNNTSPFVTHDFSGDSTSNTAKSLNEILNRNGVFTIDDNAHLTVVNPEKHRGNVFVRAIKFIFSSDYRAEDRALKRFESLRRNQSYSKLIVNTYFKRDIFKTNNICSPLHSVFQDKIKALLENRNNNQEPITPETIRKLRDNISTAKNKVSEVLTPKNTNNAVFVRGKAVSLNDFFNKYLPADKRNSFNTDTFLNKVLNNLIRADIKNLPYLDKKALAELKTIQLRIGDPTVESVTIKNCTSKLMNAILNKIGNSIEDKLRQGYSPESIANNLADGIKNVHRVLTRENAEASLNAFFGDNGTLNRTDTLKQISRNDLTAPYPESDPKRFNSYNLLRNSGVPLNSGEIDKILAFTGDDPARVDKYIRLIREGSSTQGLPKVIGELVSGLNSKGTDSLFNSARTIYNSINTFYKATGQGDIAPEQERKEILSMLTHFHTLKNDDNQKDYEKIKGAMTELTSLKANLEARLNVTHNAKEIQEINNLLADIPTAINTLESLILVAMPQETGKEPATLSKKGVNMSHISKNINEVLKFKTDPTQLNNKVRQIIGQNSYPGRDITDGLAKIVARNVVLHIESLGHVLQGENASTEDIIESYIDHYTQNQDLLDLFDKNKYTPQLMDKISNMVTGEDGLVGEYRKIIHPNDPNARQQYNMEPVLDENGKQVLDENGEPKTCEMHYSVKPDLGRGILRGFNNIDVGQTRNGQEGYQLFINEFERSIPKPFRRFVSNMIHQGGLAFLLTKNTNFPKELSPIPGVYAGSGVQQVQGKANIFPGYNIQVENNILTITAECAVNYKDFNLGIGGIKLHNLKITTTIDLSKGVDNDGVPSDMHTVSTFLGANNE